jgi:hypothetical protein
MTTLLGSMVERSVRAPPAAAVDASSPSPGATGRERAGEPARDAPPGAIVPRRRSRFEAQGAEPVLGETEERIDATPAWPTEARPDGRDTPADVGAPARSPRAVRPASDETPRHAPLETATRSIPAAAPPAAAPAAAPPASPVIAPAMAVTDGATSPTNRASAAVPRREPTAAERVATAPAAAAVAAAPASPPERSSTDEAAPVSSARSSRAPIARIAEPPPAEPPADVAPVRPGEIAPARRREPLREPARRSDPGGPRPPADRPAVPSVQVSIGRVEVRAVFAPPPSAARRPSPAPALSLDDYLKQREKGG